MRLCSVFYLKSQINSKKQVITYLIFFPEMITGPHREITEWKEPYINTKEFNLNNIIELLFFLNLILGSGCIYSLYIYKIDHIVIDIVISYIILYSTLFLLQIFGLDGIFH